MWLSLLSSSQQRLEVGGIGAVYTLTGRDDNGQSRDEAYYSWGNVLGTFTQYTTPINSMTWLCLFTDEEARA